MIRAAKSGEWTTVVGLKNGGEMYKFKNGRSQLKLNEGRLWRWVRRPRGCVARKRKFRDVEKS